MVRLVHGRHAEATELVGDRVGVSTDGERVEWAAGGGGELTAGVQRFPGRGGHGAAVVFDDDEHCSPQYTELVEQVDDGGGGFGAVTEDHRAGGPLDGSLQAHHLLPAGFASAATSRRVTSTRLEARRPFIVG